VGRKGPLPTVMGPPSSQGPFGLSGSESLHPVYQTVGRNGLLPTVMGPPSSQGPSGLSGSESLHPVYQTVGRNGPPTYSNGAAIFPGAFWP
jgi:hypothetical protein